MSEEADDKQHGPTQKRLDDARKRGEIAKSNDLVTAATYFGLLTAIIVAGPQVVESFGQSTKTFLDQPDHMAGIFFSNQNAPLLNVMLSVSKASAPLFLGPAILAIGALLCQRVIHFAPEKIRVKVSRISLFLNAKQKFGLQALIEFIKNFAKMVTVGLILWLLMNRHASDIIQSLGADPGQILILMIRISMEFFGVVLLALVGFGGVDYVWQRHQHIKKNRMSRKELLDEAKDAEGDPLVKQQRRQRGQEISINQGIQNVASADVIIVNPTHYAVALKWDRKAHSAPLCVAKGMDEIAAKIREKATEAGVPLHTDPPAARAIFATVDIGEQIKSEHFRSVAAAIRFSEAMKKRRKGITNAKR